MSDRIKLLILLGVFVIVAGDCDSDSDEDVICADTEQCCGGCCIEEVCVDSSRLCIYSQDVCEDHSCIGDETCVAYTPPECPGCEPVPVCTLLK